MLRDLLLAITGTPADGAALEAGTQLARALDAHLDVVETVSLPMFMPAPWGGIVPDALLQDVHEPLLERGRANVEALRTRLAAAGIAHEVRLAEALFAEPPQVVALHARHADMVLLGGAATQSAADAAAVRSMFAGLLFESGRPVLVVPPHHPLRWPPRHAVVAWQPTRVATRALHDALPLLRLAGSVDVVVIDPDESTGDAFVREHGADIATHLARHGLRVNVVKLHRGSASVATTLLRHAADTDAGLLVAGGFGHSRLREWVLGGTTLELLESMHLPVLFSH
ncbi:MAG TPA: universal stress protein [Thermomonas sp.]|nr:universal stress protein [Thermomonas sp.]